MSFLYKCKCHVIMIKGFSHSEDLQSLSVDFIDTAAMYINGRVNIEPLELHGRLAAKIKLIREPSHQQTSHPWGMFSLFFFFMSWFGIKSSIVDCFCIIVRIKLSFK